MAITTRPAESKVHLDRLKTILNSVSNGRIAKGSMVDPGDTMDDMISLLEKILVSAKAEVETLNHDLHIVIKDNMHMSVKLDEALTLLEGFMDIQYDDALDHATLDMMDSFCAAGVAETNADGEISWDERITMSKGDLKPILREAITRWVGLKVAP